MSLNRCLIAQLGREYEYKHSQNIPDSRLTFYSIILIQNEYTQQPEASATSRFITLRSDLVHQEAMIHTQILSINKVFVGLGKKSQKKKKYIYIYSLFKTPLQKKTTFI